MRDDTKRELERLERKLLQQEDQQTDDELLEDLKEILGEEPVVEPTATAIVSSAAKAEAVKMRTVATARTSVLTAFPAKCVMGVIPFCFFCDGNLLFFQCAVEPDSSDVDGSIEAVFFALLDHAVAGLEVCVGQLQLNRNFGGNVQILLFFGVEDLHHDDIFISHRTVIDQIIDSTERVAFVHQALCVCTLALRHGNTPSKNCNQIVTSY